MSFEWPIQEQGRDLYWHDATTLPHLPKVPIQPAEEHFPSLRALLGDAVGSLGKGKRRLAMEALEKFVDEIGRTMRQAEKAMHRYRGRIRKS